MIFETHTLTAPLDKFIESIFHFKHFSPDHSIERVVPTGHIFLLFELDGIPRNTFDNGTLKPNATFNKVWISGMHKNYLSISAPQDSEMFVIQFKPSGGHPFFHVPIDELNDRVVSAQEILGDGILDLREKILEKSTSNEKFALAENWLKSRFESSKTPNTELLSTLDQLANKPLSDHKTIVESYPKTQKHLIAQFKKYCGLTPKVLHRIFRFNEILQQINEKKEINWSQIAHQCGYTDQSHFIKEFKEFSGFNPQKFISKKYNEQEPNFFPLDKQG